MAENDALKHVVAALLDHSRHLGVEALNRLGAVQVADVQAREIEQVGLRDGDLVAVGRTDDQGQEGRASLVPVLEFEVVIDILEGALDLFLDRPVGLAAVRHDGVPVAWEGEFGLFGFDVYPLFVAGDETVGHTLVVGPEDQVEGLVAQREFVVAVAHGGFLVHGRVKGFVHALAQGLDQLGIAAPDGPVVERHRNGGGGEHLDAVRSDGIFEPVNADGDAAVRGFEGLGFGFCRKGADRTEAEQQGQKQVSFHDYG